MVRRTDDAHLSSYRGLSADGVTCKPLAGAAVALLTTFGHAIDSPNTVCPINMQHAQTVCAHGLKFIRACRIMSVSKLSNCPGK